MRSRASYDGHPLHPALIPFPFAFLTGALVFDAVGWLWDWPSWWTTGGHLAAAGVLSALVAAVPGFIDYLYTVPPRSTGKQRATRHMLVMLSAIGLFSAAWMWRQREAGTPDVLVLVCEGAGVLLLTAGGWMGGVLVSRNQISVDHRYAGAGKWKEVTIEANAGSSPAVANADELQMNQMKLLRIGDRRIVLARAEAGYVAFDDRCTHRGGSIASGSMICGTVQCPWHGSQFDTRTGAVKAGPAHEPVQTYRVEERAGLIHLAL